MAQHLLVRQDGQGEYWEYRELNRAFNSDEKYRRQLLDIYGSESLIPEILLERLKSNDLMLILSDEELSQLSLECDINVNGCVKTNGGVVLLEGDWATPNEIINLQSMVEGVLPAVLQAHTIIKKYQNNELLSA